MRGIYQSLFVDPSLGTLVPIALSVVAGAVMTAIRKIAKIGVTVLVLALVAFGIYLLWHTGAIHGVSDFLIGLFKFKTGPPSPPR